MRKISLGGGGRLSMDEVLAGVVSQHSHGWKRKIQEKTE